MSVFKLSSHFCCFGYYIAVPGHYGPELEKVLARMLLVSQVAHLARQIEAQVVTSRIADGYGESKCQVSCIVFDRSYFTRSFHLL